MGNIQNTKKKEKNEANILIKLNATICCRLIHFHCKPAVRFFT